MSYKRQALQGLDVFSLGPIIIVRGLGDYFSKYSVIF